MIPGCDYFSTYEIADRLREPPARIDYVIRKYRIKAVACVGSARLFSMEQIKAIQEGLYLLRPSHRRTI